MNDDELEQAMRTGLQRHADRADVSAPVLTRVRPGGRRRAGTVLAVAGLVAACVVTVAVVAGRTGPDVEVAADLATPSDAGSGPMVTGTGWRTEVWRDLQVDVPAEWGFGGGPDARGLACFPEPILDAGGRPAGDGLEPSGYVGRPVVMTDVCASLDAGGPLAGPYVWLGGGVRPGVVQLDDGLVQETVEVDGTSVTVATYDEELRRRILDSVGGSESCLSELDRSGPIGHDRAADPTAAPATLRVCTYRLADPDGGAGGWELTSATDLGEPSLAAYLAAVDPGGPPEDQCSTVDYQLTEAAVLEILDARGGVLRQDAVNTTSFCGGIAVDADRVWPLETTALTPAMTRPWVVGVVGAVLHGDPDLGFIGPQG